MQRDAGNAAAGALMAAKKVEPNDVDQAVYDRARERVIVKSRR